MVLLENEIVDAMMNVIDKMNVKDTVFVITVSDADNNVSTIIIRPDGTTTINVR